MLIVVSESADYLGMDDLTIHVCTPTKDQHDLQCFGQNKGLGTGAIQEAIGSLNYIYGTR